VLHPRDIRQYSSDNYRLIYFIHVCPLCRTEISLVGTQFLVWLLHFVQQDGD